MSSQLRLEGDPSFEPHSMEYMLKELFVGPIREHLRWEHNFALSIPKTRVTSMYKPYQMALVEPAPKCESYMELDDQCIECNLDRGHSTPHFDAELRVEWMPR
jgi:hypothetical protein